MKLTNHIYRYTIAGMKLVGFIKKQIFSKGRDLKMLSAYHEQKINEAILYISQKVTNKFNIYKILYYADKEHLHKYGRFITEDKYKRMYDGPVPSYTDDLIKRNSGINNKFTKQVNVGVSFSVEKRKTIKPNDKPKMEYLSVSDIECLDEAISQYGNLSIPELDEIVKNDKPVQNTKVGHYISVKDLALDSKDGEELLEYLFS